MRTIASTFSTREEAETAGRRLERIGIAPDRIVLKYLADAGEFFISAKAAPEQIGAATEILQPPRAEAPIPAAAGEGLSNGSGATPEAREVPVANPVFGSDAPREAIAQERPVAPTRMTPVAGTVAGDSATTWVRTGGDDWQGTGRRVVVFCLVLLVAFVAGALLGLVT